MAELTFPHLPNQIDYNYAPGDTAWHDITASLDAGYVGKPGVAGTIRTQAASGLADGSPCKFKINGVIPTLDTQGRLVSGSGQTFSSPGPLWKMFVRATVSTDIIQISQFF